MYGNKFIFESGLAVVRKKDAPGRADGFSVVYPGCGCFVVYNVSNSV